MDALDVISIDEAKRIISLRNDDQNAELGLYVTAVSRKLDDMCGPIINRTVTETHDGGCNGVRIIAEPVDSFTSVTEYAGTTAQVLTAETSSSQTATSYLWDPLTGYLRRRGSGSDAYFAAGRKNVVVVMTSGRGTTADERFKRAAGIILGQLWKRERGAGTETFGAYEGMPTGFAVPNAAVEILGRELRDGPWVG